jgi:hypothetical protein
MALSPYTRHDRLIVVDVEPQHVAVQGAEGAPPYRARCIRASDSPPLMRGDTVKAGQHILYLKVFHSCGSAMLYKPIRGAE